MPNRKLNWSKIGEAVIVFAVVAGCLLMLIPQIKMAQNISATGGTGDALIGLTGTAVIIIIGLLIVSKNP